MSKARQLADLLDSNGDVVAGALDNAPDPDLTPYATTASLSTLQSQVDNLPTNLVDDTTPQLGGNLDANGFSIDIGQGEYLDVGDLRIQNYDTYNTVALSTTGNGNSIYIAPESGSGVYIKNGAHPLFSSEMMASFAPNGAVTLYHDNQQKFATNSSGVSITGTCAATSFTGDGSGLTGIVAGDGSYNGSFKVKANGGYFIGIQMTNLPVGATLVYCFRKVYNNSNNPITVNCRTGGGSSGFSGGSWREVSESTQNSHSSASFNTGGTVNSSMSSGSAHTYSQIKDGAVLYVSLTGTTANVPLYGGTAFTAIIDTFLVDL